MIIYIIYYQDIGEKRMKRVLVLSDSHGNVGNMIRAVKREEPDMILHLGDCVVDAEVEIARCAELAKYFRDKLVKNNLPLF